MTEDEKKRQRQSPQSGRPPGKQESQEYSRQSEYVRQNEYSRRDYARQSDTVPERRDFHTRRTEQNPYFRQEHLSGQENTSRRSSSVQQDDSLRQIRRTAQKTVQFRQDSQIQRTQDNQIRRTTPTRQDSQFREARPDEQSRKTGRNKDKSVQGGFQVLRNLLARSIQFLSTIGILELLLPGMQSEPRPRRQKPMTREELTARQMQYAAEQEQKRRKKEYDILCNELSKGPFDKPFFFMVLLLTAVGLIMLLSASFPAAYDQKGNPLYFFNRQAVFAVIGVAAMLFISRFDYHILQKIQAGKFLLLVSIILLLLVLVPFIGIMHNNARRWLGIGPLEFQPSEIAKLAVVILFSDSIAEKKEEMKTLRGGILPYMGVLILVGGLVVLEPHLSGAILIVGTGAILMLVGGINWGWVLGLGGAGISVIYIAVGVLGYNTSRLQMWQNPFSDSLGKGYQLSQSLISIGSGGLMGLGLGKSRQKFLYLPESQNDFIFAIICEELGLIGATIIMLLFAAFILRGYWIALRARDRFGSLLVVGTVSLLAIQTFLNIGVVSGLLPTTGISLPFFSYGGTALTIQLAGMGIVLSVSRQMRPGRGG